MVLTFRVAPTDRLAYDTPVMAPGNTRGNRHRNIWVALWGSSHRQLALLRFGTDASHQAIIGRHKWKLPKSSLQTHVMRSTYRQLIAQYQMQSSPIVDVM